MVTWTETVLVLTAAANAVAAVLAWLAKLRWSKEYQNATNKIIESKDESIRAKEAEIAVLQRYADTLQQLNPKEIAEWYEGMKTMFSEYTGNLHGQLAKAEQTIQTLEASGKAKDEEIQQKKEAYQKLSAQVSQIDLALSQRRLPDVITVVNSGNYSRALDESTAGAAPAVKFDLGAWYEVDCEICGRSIRIHRDWDNPPKVHKECRERKATEK